jgi:hypothetical protein
MFCCCCCLPKVDCGDDWVDYSSVAYFIWYQNENISEWVDGDGRLHISAGAFNKQNFEQPLKNIYIDGYSFVPRNYVSPSLLEPECLQDDSSIDFVFPDSYTDTEIKAVYDAFGSRLQSQLECFLKNNSDWGDLSDYSTQSEIIFDVAGVPYRKKVYACVKNQKFVVLRTSYEFSQDTFNVPRIEVYFECQYAIRVTIPEEVTE